MKIEEIRNGQLQETYYTVDHPSGLRIYVMPKQGYASTYAIFGTRYGSVDTCFRSGVEDVFTTVPEGIAHFLEHKLFESEELDAFARYAKTGASANAYTSFDRTCYLFSCTGDFDASLAILLDFVQSPYFTKETVQKEQGIIGQEIRMYQDDPGWQVEFNLLRALYQKNPVRIDIAGTIDSIAKIDDKLLYTCYNTFYNLHNMTLAVVGNVTVEQVLKAADAYLKPSEPLKIERAFPQEPDGVVEGYTEQKLSVAVPLFMLGYKEACRTPERTLEERVASQVLLQAIAGEASPLYKRLMQKGLISPGFGAEYFTGYGYAAMLFAGESTDPKAAAAEIRAELEAVRSNGVAPAAFERAKKLLYGRVIMGYNDVDTLANTLVDAHFGGHGLFDRVEQYKNVTIGQVNARAAVLREEASALSVVLPA